MLEGPRPMDSGAVALREPPHGLPFPDKQSNGFTAVNGQSFSGFRPAAPAEGPRPWRSSSAKSSPGEAITVSTSLPSHGWRPDIREVTNDQREEPADSPLKRKRSSPDDDATLVESTVDGRESPKRRQLPNILDSAIDLTSPDTDSVQQSHVAVAPAAPRQSSREPSPVRNGNQGQPPPAADARVLADLAESAKKFNESEPGENITLAEKVPIPPLDSSQILSHDPNTGEYLDESDPKRNRKRHFANRTKTGCHTCRQRKKKCDERKPTCLNCERGHFECHGYGAKPPGLIGAPVSTRKVIPAPMSARPVETPHQGPTSFWQTQNQETGKSYSHWGRLPEPAKLQEIQPNRETSSWQQPNWHSEPPAPPPQPQPLPQPLLPPPPPQQPPPSQYYATERPSAPAPDYHHTVYQQHHTHHMPGHQAQMQPLPPPPPVPIEQWTPNPHSNSYTPHRQYAAPGPGTVVSHVSSSNSGDSDPGSYKYFQRHPELIEKDKMLRGQPYLHHTDSTLIHDRNRCLVALNQYNNAFDPNQGINPNQRAEFFSRILDTTRRPNNHAGYRHYGPTGDIGDRTLVESPFKCDYGYNIHLGHEVVIYSECYMQDAGGVWIEDRVTIGPQTKILTMTASLDAKDRRGSQGTVRAGRIEIKKDAWIGANCIILPYVTIGEGAVIGAGSVVTHDIKPYTVAAGNPARHMRNLNHSLDRHQHAVLDDQEKAAIEKMQDYANCQWKPRSPKTF